MSVLNYEGNVSTSIDYLPDELLVHIFKFLPLDTILICENVCKRWKKLALDPSLWRRFVLTYSGKPGQSETSKKNQEVISSHSKHVYHIKIQYVYTYTVIKSLIDTCDNLISLELIMCRIGQEFKDDILRWPRLKKISLKNSILLVNNVNLLIEFNYFKELNYLALSDFGLDPSNCDTLLHCQYLTHIFIEKIRDLHLDFIRELITSKQTILEALHIYGDSAVDDNVLKLLSKCLQLKDLAIIKCSNLTDAGFVSLTNLKKLEHLQIWNNKQITEPALLSTLGSPTLLTLQSLSLSRILSVTPAIVDLISEYYKNLKFLALYQCPQIIDADYERQLKLKFRNIDVVLF